LKIEKAEAGGKTRQKGWYTMKYLHLVKYDGGAVYEPAEGGYYVPTMSVSAVSECKYGRKHALRAFRQEVEAMKEEYGEPDSLTKTSAHWTIGRYIGEEIEMHIESRIGSHEVSYKGYC
jgi:hypothetical protein